ncbi:MAG: histidinol-phosphate transaminase [Acutalibacteraceae bacterium]|nr:histidinol-phosphate transaminase [Acutalibacteraceae bacterium]
MSRFLSDRRKNLVPYTPGEQPKDMKYIKLNTNESPFPPSKKALDLTLKAAQRLNLYPDPECKELTEEIAKMCKVSPSQVLVTNGSDEILNFAFIAFCDEKTKAVFPDITYGFYPVFAEINNVPFEEIPLNDDFSISIDDYLNINKNIFIANPNAPTGMVISLSDIEKILKTNPDNIVVIDEAYVDFGGESAIPLVNKYDNLLVTQTFSKSRSMAGARLGFGVASSELIRDLNTVKYSTNPYNINSMSMAAGLGVLSDDEYTKGNCKEIIKNREYTVSELKKIGFETTSSFANFLFIRSDIISGEEVYLKLKEKGVLVRHFNKEKIADYNRVTIGDRAQMEIFIEKLKEVLEEKNENC